MNKQVIIHRSLPDSDRIKCDREEYMFFDIAKDNTDRSGMYIPSDEELLFKDRKLIAVKIIEELEAMLARLRYVNIALSRLLKETEVSVLKATAFSYKKKKITITLCPAAGDILTREEEALSILTSGGVDPSSIVLAGIVPCTGCMDRLSSLCRDGVRFLFNGFFDNRIMHSVSFEEQLFAVKYLVKLGFAKNIMLTAEMYTPNMLSAIVKSTKLKDALLRFGLCEDELSQILSRNPYAAYFT